MTTWPDVWLALAGAPIGALITVAGVWLTNRHNATNHQSMLDSQERQQRERLDFDLRVEVQRESLRERSSIYLEVLADCDWAERLADWAQANELPDNVGPLANEDIIPAKESLPKLRRKVEVHCSGEVRGAMRSYETAFDAVDETADDAYWDDLRREAKALRSCVIAASVMDRSSDLVVDGLGGA